MYIYVYIYKYIYIYIYIYIHTPTSLPITPLHFIAGCKLSVRHVPTGFVSLAAKDRATLLIHTNHLINTSKHSTPTPLGEHTQKPWLYPSPPLTKGCCLCGVHETAQTQIAQTQIFLKTNADIHHLLDSLVSALAVYATAFRSKLSLE